MATASMAPEKIDPSLLVYHYQPLIANSELNGEMRLLTLLPGVEGSQIACSLSHVSIRSPPPYEALSYTWGTTKGEFSTVSSPRDPNQMHTIMLDGLFKTIGDSLHVALQHLRNDLEARTLWIDALCIDQDNDVEKSEQVHLMAEIYKQSKKTIAWLGEHDKFVDLAFDTLEDLCWATKILIIRYCANKLGLSLPEISSDVIQSLIKSEFENSASAVISPFKGLHFTKAMKSFQKAMDSVALGKFFQGAVSPDDIAVKTWEKPGSFAEAILSNRSNLSQLSDFEDRMDALKEVFFRRSYWERLWVVQEILLSPDVTFVCGQRSADLNLMTIVNCIRNAVVPSTGSSILVSSEDRVFLGKLTSNISLLLYFQHVIGRDQQRSLAESYHDYGERYCSDPRDAIFALLHISKPIHIVPDYKKSAAEVYIAATRAIIEQEQNLNIICTEPGESISKRLGCPLPVNIPSWVPHFESHTSPARLFIPEWSYEEQLFKGGSVITPNLKEPDVQHSQVLEIDGCFYGTLENVQSQFDPYSFDTESELWLAVNKLHAFISSVETISNSAKVDMESWYVLVMDTYQVTDMRETERPSRHSGARDSLAADLEVALRSEVPSQLISELSSSLEGKTLCTTSTGHVALVLGEVQVGDRIFVARGATNPFVLRPAVADETYDEVKKLNPTANLYNFVGGSYLHGLMDGEVLDKTHEIGKGLKEETVHLI